MANTGSGTGQGGKTLNDRKLAAEVRTMSLRQMKAILEGKDAGKLPYTPMLHEDLLKKLAATALPRLNEHSGEDGGPIEITGVSINVRKT